MKYIFKEIERSKARSRSDEIYPVKLYFFRGNMTFKVGVFYNDEESLQVVVSS